jgi:mRNA interferase RelE/StbE
MAKYELIFRPSVWKDLEQIPKVDVRRILKRIDSLAGDARPPGSTKLSGQEAYRIRQGNYRIVYVINDTRLIITIVKVGHRSTVYEW